MAKPIRATPTLTGQDTIRFIQKMVEEEKTPNRQRIKLIKESLRIRFDISN